jgi:hypothetical protein
MLNAATHERSHHVLGRQRRNLYSAAWFDVVSALEALRHVFMKRQSQIFNFFAFSALDPSGVAHETGCGRLFLIGLCDLIPLMVRRHHGKAIAMTSCIVLLLFCQ